MTLFLFIYKYYCILLLYYILFTHYQMIGHFGHVFSSHCKNATVCVFTSLEHKINKEWIIFNFITFWKIARPYFKAAKPVCIFTNSVWRFQFLYILLNSIVVYILIILMLVKYIILFWLYGFKNFNSKELQKMSQTIWVFKNYLTNISSIMKDSTKVLHKWCLNSLMFSVLTKLYFLRKELSKNFILYLKIGIAIGPFRT